MIYTLQRKAVKKMDLHANEGKNEIIEVDGISYSRFPIKTHVVTENDDIAEVAQTYAGEYLQGGDILVISEKCVGLTASTPSSLHCKN